MSDPAGNDDHELLRRALEGDEPALVALFDGFRDRLRKMIRLRLDRRLVALQGAPEKFLIVISRRIGHRWGPPE